VTSIATLKATLVDLIEPDYGLLDQLMSLGVLTRHQYGDIRSKKGAFYKRNEKLLQLLINMSEEQCQMFLSALQKTGQQHVVNYIRGTGGQKITKFFR